MDFKTKSMVVKVSGENLIERKAFNHSVILEVLSLPILNRKGTGKIFKTSREIHERVQCIYAFSISRVCLDKCNLFSAL